MSTVRYVNKATRQLRQSGVPLARAAAHAGRKRRQSPLVLLAGVAGLAMLAGGAAMALVTLRLAPQVAAAPVVVPAPVAVPAVVAATAPAQTPFAMARREVAVETTSDAATMLSNLKTAVAVSTAPAAPVAPDCRGELNAVAQAMQVTFGISSNALDPATSDALDQLATKAAQCDGVQIVVAGHSDTTGAPEANDALSWQRADEVVAAIVRQGHAPGLFKAVGYGAREPVMTGGVVDDAASRRVEFMVTMATDVPVPEVTQ